MDVSAARALRFLPARWRRPTLTRPIGLQARIALLVSSGLLALIAIFVVLGLSALRDSTERVFQERVLLAQMAAEHLDFILGQAAAAGTGLAPDLAVSLESGNEEVSRALMRDASRRWTTVASGFLLFDPAGKLLQSEPFPGELPHPDVSRAVGDALSAGKPSAVDWIRGPQGAVALVVVPVVGSGGQRLGFLGIAVDLSGPVVGHWLGQMALGKTGQVDLVDGQGVLLASTTGDPLRAPEGHAGLVSSLMAERRPQVTTCSNCHSAPNDPARRQEVMAFAPLKAADWGILVRQSEAEVLEPTQRLQQQVLGLGVVSLLIGLLMVWITTRSVVGPIHSLSASARRIADGRLDEPVAVEGTDEIAELGSSLEYMRVSLRRSIEEIRCCNAELERRVQERTAELEQSRDDLERSHDHLQTLIGRLSTLNSLAVALNRSLDLDTILNGALVNALKLAGLEAGAVYLLDETTGELELAAHHGLSREAARVAANLGLSASVCAAVAQAGEPLVVEDTGKYARGTRSVLRDENMRCMVRVPFKSTNGLLGTMCLGTRNPRTFSKEELELLVSVSNQIAVAVQNARLYEELQRKERKRGELLLKVITAQEEERKRIARELHDQTSQALAALGVAVETAAAQAAEGGDVAASLARMRSLTHATLEEVHRLIFDLRPTLLDDLGLIAALRWYAETRLGEVGIRVRLEVVGEERRMAPQVETALYRVVQEAVNNVANHSGAQNFIVTLVIRPGSLSLTMVDDGWGFDMAELARSRDRKRGLGLMGMKERVELLGGTFTIYSELGSGTKITLEVPIEGEDRDDGGQDKGVAG